MAADTTDEEKKGTVFLLACGGIVLAVLGVVAWMALNAGPETSESATAEETEGWVHLGRSGVLDVSYMVESVSGSTVSLVRKAECSKGICLNAMTSASASMGDAEGENAPTVFETDMQVDCTSEEFREDDVRVYSKSGDLITSDTSPMSEKWYRFEDLPKSSLEYNGLVKKVCEDEARAKAAAAAEAGD